MSSFEPSLKPTASSGPANAPKSAETGAASAPQRHIPPGVAHELNNILTLIQGYAEHLLSKHRENLGLQPSLLKISEAAHRAALLIREARSPDPKLSSQ